MEKRIMSAEEILKTINEATDRIVKENMRVTEWTALLKETYSVLKNDIAYEDFKTIVERNLW